MALRQSIAKVSLAGYRPLARPVRRLQHPQPDRFTVVATDPLTEPGDLPRHGQGTAQPLLGLRRDQAPVEEEPMHHWVGVQVDQKWQVVLGQRDEFQPVSSKGRLRHRVDRTPPGSRPGPDQGGQRSEHGLSGCPRAR